MISVISVIGGNSFRTSFFVRRKINGLALRRRKTLPNLASDTANLDLSRVERRVAKSFASRSTGVPVSIQKNSGSSFLAADETPLSAFLIWCASSATIN